MQIHFGWLTSGTEGLGSGPLAKLSPLSDVVVPRRKDFRRDGKGRLTGHVLGPSMEGNGWV